MPLILRPPRINDEAPLRRMHQQLRAENFTFLPTEASWEQLLDTVEREASGIDLPPGRVRADFLVAEVNDMPVGRVSIRHELNDYLHAVGGHIGYAVAPEHRRRGYATEILRQSVARLKFLGVGHALVTCEKNNAASAAVIESCGGTLEDSRTVDGRCMSRYWITTR